MQLIRNRCNSVEIGAIVTGIGAIKLESGAIHLLTGANIVNDLQLGSRSAQSKLISIPPSHTWSGSPAAPRTKWRYHLPHFLETAIRVERYIHS